MSHPVHSITARPILGPADLQLLLAFGRYFYLTATQLTRLFYAPTSHTYAQARLKRLADGGYLQRIFLPRPSRTGSAPLVYTLARRGLQALDAWGRPVARRYRPAEVRETSYLHLAHTLALNDLLIALECFCRRESRVTIAGWRHERELKLQPVGVQLSDGTRAGVIPDAWLDLRLAGRYQECYVVELDRGTTEQKAWRRKLAALVAYSDGPYQAAFGTPSLTIVVATPDERRCQQLLRWTEAELRAIQREDAANLVRLTGAQPGGEDPTDIFEAASWWTPFRAAPGPLLDLRDIAPEGALEVMP